MAFNVPAVDTTRYSFGPGVLKLGPAGTTPTVDVGSVKSDASFVVERETLEVNQGSPATRQKVFILKETAVFSISTLEWNLNNLALAAGAGITSTVGDTDTLNFGGDPNVDSVALEFEHVLPSGATVIFRIWKADPTGGLSFNFTDELHEFPQEFSAIESTTDWAGNALAAGARLFQIKHIRA